MFLLLFLQRLLPYLAILSTFESHLLTSNFVHNHQVFSQLPQSLLPFGSANTITAENYLMFHSFYAL